jgi:hypothetical protein
MSKKPLELLNELVNPETFAFERGSDYGKGAPAKSTEITTKKMTDTLDSMTRATPSVGLSMPLNGSYLGEDAIKTKSRREKESDVLPKAESAEMEADTKHVPGHVQKLINNLVLELAEMAPGPRECATSLFNAKLDAVRAVDVAEEAEQAANKTQTKADEPSAD